MTPVFASFVGAFFNGYKSIIFAGYEGVEKVVGVFGFDVLLFPGILFPGYPAQVHSSK